VFKRSNLLTVPKGKDSKSKQEDPNWRNHWKLILLKSTGDKVCYPQKFELSSNGRCMETMFMLRTRYFAMRVGDRPFQLITVDLDGEVHIPEIYCFKEGIPFIEGDVAFSFYVENVLREEITYI
jgi:hypothetical protein